MEPSLPFLTLPTNDLISLNPVTNDQIGVYPVKLLVENLVGYNLPSPGGNLPTIEYDFIATVKPCPLDEVTLTGGDQTVDYTVGDPSVSSQSLSDTV